MTSRSLSYYYPASTGVLSRRGQAVGSPPIVVSPTYLLNVTFDDWTTFAKGAIGVTYWNTRMGGGGGTTNLEDSSVVAVSGEGNVLRTFLEANTIRSNPAGNHGSAMVVPLSQQVEEAYFEYRIRFTGAFGWGKGGKILGLAGVAPGTSLSFPAGGNGPHVTVGWSNRSMWLSPGAGFSSQIGTRANIGVDYDYGFDQVDQYGDVTFWPTATPTTQTFLADTWYVIRKRIRMNTVGAADGIQQTWLGTTTDNLVLVNSKTTRQFRTRSDVKIGLIYWDVFRGGATIDWASSSDANVDVSYFKVWTQ